MYIVVLALLALKRASLRPTTDGRDKQKGEEGGTEITLFFLFLFCLFFSSFFSLLELGLRLRLEGALIPWLNKKSV